MDPAASRPNDDMDTGVNVMNDQVSTFNNNNMSQMNQTTDMEAGELNENMDTRINTQLEDAEGYQMNLEEQLPQGDVVIAKDIPYDLARQKVETITLRMAEIWGCAANIKLRVEYNRLEEDLKKYTAALELTDEWAKEAKEQAERERQWEASVAAANDVALRKLRRHVPVNYLITLLTPNGRFLPDAMVTKFMLTNVLKLLRIDPKDIVQMPYSTLENMRVTGLTLTEHRALYAHLKEVGPQWKAAQDDKMAERKWIWFNMMKFCFKEKLDSWQRHVDQYGPPENHPYSTQGHPHVGCPLIGMQCPVKADKIINYDGDYGFPVEGIYFKAEVKKSDTNNASKAKAEALSLACEKKLVEQSESLTQNLKINILQVSQANGSSEAMDDVMDNVELNQGRLIQDPASSRPDESMDTGVDVMNDQASTVNSNMSQMNNKNMDTRMNAQLEDVEGNQTNLEQEQAAGTAIEEDIPSAVAMHKVETITLRMAEIAKTGGCDIADMKDMKLMEHIQRLSAELDATRNQDILIEKQVEQAGVAIAEDVPYDMAEIGGCNVFGMKLNEDGSCTATLELMDKLAEKEANRPRKRHWEALVARDMEKYTATYTATLDVLEKCAEKEAELERQWEASVAAANEVALRKLRRHMPVNVCNLSEAELSTQPTPNGRFLPKKIAKKLKRTNILQLLRIDPEDIVSMHPSMLESLRVHRLTLTERRALYVHLKDVGPRWKKAQGDKQTERKWTWFNMMKSNFKEDVDSWQRHVDQYGPPENHPYARRDHPHDGCPLIGMQCPLKEDKLQDYEGDYGFPEEAIYFKAEVNKLDAENASKAKLELLGLAREKNQSEESEALKRCLKRKVLHVSPPNSSCEAKDKAMNKMELNQERWIGDPDPSPGGCEKPNPPNLTPNPRETYKRKISNLTDGFILVTFIPEEGVIWCQNKSADPNGKADKILKRVIPPHTDVTFTIEKGSVRDICGTISFTDNNDTTFEMRYVKNVHNYTVVLPDGDNQFNPVLLSDEYDVSHDEYYNTKVARIRTAMDTTNDESGPRRDAAEDDANDNGQRTNERIITNMTDPYDVSHNEYYNTKVAQIRTAMDVTMDESGPLRDASGIDANNDGAGDDANNDELKTNERIISNLTDGCILVTFVPEEGVIRCQNELADPNGKRDKILTRVVPPQTKITFRIEKRSVKDICGTMIFTVNNDKTFEMRYVKNVHNYTMVLPHGDNQFYPVLLSDEYNESHDEYYNTKVAQIRTAMAKLALGRDASGDNANDKGARDDANNEGITANERIITNLTDGCILVTFVPEEGVIMHQNEVADPNGKRDKILTKVIQPHTKLSFRIEKRSVKDICGTMIFTLYRDVTVETRYIKNVHNYTVIIPDGDNTSYPVLLSDEYNVFHDEYCNTKVARMLTAMAAMGLGRDAACDDAKDEGTSEAEGIANIATEARLGGSEGQSRFLEKSLIVDPVPAESSGPSQPEQSSSYLSPAKDVFPAECQKILKMGMSDGAVMTTNVDSVAENIHDSVMEGDVPGPCASFHEGMALVQKAAATVPNGLVLVPKEQADRTGHAGIAAIPNELTGKGELEDYVLVPKDQEKEDSSDGWTLLEDQLPDDYVA